MASLDHAQLSSLAAGIEDLAERAATIAEDLDTSDTAEAANALFEAERSLHMASRAVQRATKVVTHRPD